jgi:subtilisin family serine protease
LTKTILRNSLVLWVTAVLTPAGICQSAQTVLPSHVPNEVIVKFREKTTDSFEMRPEPENAATAFRLCRELDELNTRGQVRTIKPLFKDFKKRRQLLEALGQKSESSLSVKERRILRRTGRAPKGARVPDLGRIYKVQVKLEHGRSLQELVAALSNDPNVEYAELNYIVSVCAEPNDSLYPVQWSLNNTGQDYPIWDGTLGHGISDCDIDAPEAWDVNVGSPAVIVGVIDSGVDYTHRDLNDNMWINEAEMYGTEGIDDDGNGYTDDIYGYDFINTDSDPKDDYGHGTHCSGIIAAEGNNDLDITGVCWNAKIMALKFLNQFGEGSIDAAAQAVYYAADNGADVISNSWGVPGVLANQAKCLQEAMDYAHSQGVVIVASAGNEGWDFPSIPAGYENVIAVAATDSNNQLGWFSNFGDWVDIAAPGVDILSLLAANLDMSGYDDYTVVASGTSMACPYVAGASALILSNCPAVQVESLRRILLESTDPIAPGICISGRLNLYEALSGLSTGRVHFGSDAYSCSATQIEIVLMDFDLMGKGTQQVTLTTSGGDAETIELTEDSNSLGIFAATMPIAWADPNIEDGAARVRPGQSITVTYQDAHGSTGEPATTQDTAAIDCEPPVISSVQVQVRGVVARVSFETNEPTTAVVRCGFECNAPYPIITEEPFLLTTHTIYLRTLVAQTDYHFVVEANDAAGNQTIDNNDGACYAFTTTTPFTLRVPADFPTIQAAIDAAEQEWRDTVSVADGTYTGEGNRDIDFCGKAITLRSDNGPDNCIIDCNAPEWERHRGFYFHSSEGPNSIVDGFTITNGYGPDEKFGNDFQSVGGAIYCKGSAPKIVNCIIKNNRARVRGGGIFCYNVSIPYNFSTPTISDCIITGNYASSGGGLYACNGPIRNCIISNNSAHWSGGGLYGCDGPIDDCTITGNFSDSSGAGLDNCHGPISNCIISDNAAAYAGGGLQYCLGPISNCIISGNRADSRGGGGLSECSYGPISNCIIVGNSTTGSKGGGGLYECNADIVNCTIVSNSANCGGGIYDTGITTRPWLWPDPPHTIPVANCIIYDNRATTGTQIYLNNRGNLSLAYSDLQGDQNDVYVGYQSVFYWKAGNIDADPCFAVPGYWADINDPNIPLEPTDPNAIWIDGDYHLKSQAGRWDPNSKTWVTDDVISACVDAGDPDADWSGELWPHGKRANMGAYGGTSQASMSLSNASNIADLDLDGCVRYADLMLLADRWLTQQLLLPEDLSRDGIVNLSDFAIFAGNWSYVESSDQCVGSPTGSSPTSDYAQNQGQ